MNDEQGSKKINILYNDFKNEYRGKGIDDFENFIKARILEYLLNTTEFSTETIFATINMSLDDIKDSNVDAELSDDCRNEYQAANISESPNENRRNFMNIEYILKKINILYNNFTNEYKDKGIDDFENFIKARIFEYLLNTTDFSTETILATINKYIDDNKDSNVGTKRYNDYQEDYETFDISTKTYLATVSSSLDNPKESENFKHQESNWKLKLFMRIAGTVVDLPLHCIKLKKWLDGFRNKNESE